MRFFAILLALLVSGSAFAADLATKAPVIPSYLQYPTGAGIFYGVGFSGTGGTASADNAAGGAVVGGTAMASVGYTGVLGKNWWFVEQEVKGTINNGASQIVTLKPQVEFETRFGVGVPQNVFSQFANMVFPSSTNPSMPSIPALPGNITINSMNPYIFGGLHALDVSASVGGNYATSWLFSWGAGVGNMYRLSNGLVLDTSLEYVHQSTGMLIGATNVKFDDRYEAMVSLKF